MKIFYNFVSKCLNPSIYPFIGYMKADAALVVFY